MGTERQARGSGIQLADMEMVMRYVEDIRGLLSQGSLSEQKAFIRSFVKEVRVTGKEVLIIYTMPLPPNGTIHERAGVLSIVHDGGAGGIRTRYLLTASQALSQLSYSPRCSLKISIKLNEFQATSLDFT